MFSSKITTAKKKTQKTKKKITKKKREKEILNTIICLNYSFTAVVSTQQPSLYPAHRHWFLFTSCISFSFSSTKTKTSFSLGFHFILSLLSFLGHRYHLQFAKSNSLISMDKIMIITFVLASVCIWNNGKQHHNCYII